MPQLQKNIIYSTITIFKNQKKKSKCSNQGACRYNGGNYKDHSKHRKHNIFVFIKQ